MIISETYYLMLVYFSCMNSDEYLPLSGIQHFAFCKRQWALIHIEQIWCENALTFSGRMMHKNADKPQFTECRGDVIISRAVPLVSHRLKIYGVSDVVEYHRCEDGISLPKHRGKWKIVPVEYKSGKKKRDSCDEVQVCCQAMCLEEMTGCHIDAGYLFYGKTRNRVEVVFDDRLRSEVESLVSEMYRLFEEGVTPAAEYQKGCESCSLKNICVPQLSCARSVEEYVSRLL